MESTQKDHILAHIYWLKYIGSKYIGSKFKNLTNLRLISNDSSSDTDGQSDIGLNMESFHRYFFTLATTVVSLRTKYFSFVFKIRNSTLNHLQIFICLINHSRGIDDDLEPP